MSDTPKPVSRRVRFEILRRDGHTCRYCGATAPDVPLTVDHVIPRALGGSDDPTNLITACRDCNSGKGSTSPDEHIVADVDASALLFAKAIEKVNADRRKALSDLDQHIADFEELWNRLTTYGEGKYRAPLPLNWPNSITRFLENGLTMGELDFYVETAWRCCRDIDATFKYFCGCCWRELTDRQEMARRLIEDGAI